VATKPLKPEDVTPAQAAAVLRFLNGAQTTQEIAAAVELPNEKDVGDKLAGRILAYRKKNGPFTTIGQLLDVPQIGPARFTQIVLSLTRQVQEPNPPTPVDVSYQALLDEVRALRAALGAGGARWTASLRAAATSLFLGQQTKVEATVLDARAMPQAGVPVTFTCTAGELFADDGADILQGQSVVARTDLQGTASVLLRSPSVEGMTRDQRRALETALRDLPPTAKVPSEMAGQLTELARQYRWDINVQLREAIDVLAETFQQRLSAINFVDPMASFSVLDSTVVAYAQRAGAVDEPAERTSVDAVAALNLRYKNWLGAWYAAYLGILESQSKLTSDLQVVKRSGKSAADMLAEIRDRVCRFVRKEPGLAGEHVGQQMAERTLQGFVADGLPNFPIEDTSTLIAELGNVSECLRKKQVTVVSAVAGAGKVLRKDLGKNLSEMATLRADVVDVKSKVTSVGAYDQRLVAVEGALASKADISAVGDVADLRRGLLELSAIKADLDDVKTRIPSKLPGT
jgi:hypothetical protein